jgi:hypothetical protein
MGGWHRAATAGVALVTGIVAVAAGVGVGTPPSGAQAGRAQAGGLGPQLTASPTTGLLPGDEVVLAGTGFAPGQYHALWCTPDLDPADPTTIAETCRGVSGGAAVGADGTFASTYVVERTAGNWLVGPECGDGPATCRLVLSPAPAGDPAAALVASVPLGLVPETFSVTPDRGVLEGQALTLSGAGLPPNSASIVMQCPDGVSEDAYDQLSNCDLYPTGPIVQLVAGPDGEGTTTVVAQSLVGHGSPFAQHYCTDQCHIRVLVGSQTRSREVPIAFAEPEVVATPAAGLVDGRTVQVDGTGLRLSYDGQPVWIFPSGGWSLTQCDATVLDDPGLADVFDRCAAAPTTRGVTVDDNELHEPIEVRSRFTSFLGREVDCTVAPGACVVGLVRLEENTEVRAHLTPIAFGG